MRQPQRSNREQFAFDRFAIDSLVGSGGMASVYRAYDTRLDRFVALKVMGADAGAGAGGAENNPASFLAEAKSSARLANPYTVAIFDSGIAAGQCFIVMEYVDGIDLKCALERHGKFTGAATARIGTQLCQALEDAHGNGIVHSDIKPSNVMLTRTGMPKLTDFGIARARIKAELGQPAFGTPHYVSPEQAAGQGARPQSDVYSLGVTLYELCTGRLPSTTFGNARENGASADNAPIPPSLLNGTVNEGLDEILEICMQHDPGARYPSARRLRHHLETYLDACADEAPCVVPPGNPPQYWVLLPQGQQGDDISAFKLIGSTVIGRGPDADIRLDDPIVSGTHAKADPWGACLLVSDLESSNGTALNGMPVGVHAIAYPGDIVTVGTTDFLIACKW